MGNFYFYEKTIDKLAFANYNKDTKLAEANYQRKELFPMTIHPLIHSVGAMIGGLMTLGLFVYNLHSLLNGNRKPNGCRIS